MRTNNVPALIMLLAGAVECVAAIVTHQTLWAFTKQLFLVLIIFYILGSVVKLILDRNFTEDDFEEVELGEEVKQQEQSEQEDKEGEQENDHEEQEIASENAQENQNQ